MLQEISEFLVKTLPEKAYRKIRGELTMAERRPTLRDGTITFVLEGRTEQTDDQQIAEAYEATRSKRIGAYRRRTDTGIETVSSHVRGASKKSFMKRLQSIIGLKAKPKQDEGEMVREAIDWAIEQSLIAVKMKYGSR